jgi:hypothetical protein
VDFLAANIVPALAPPAAGRAAGAHHKVSEAARA